MVVSIRATVWVCRYSDDRLTRPGSTSSPDLGSERAVPPDPALHGLLLSEVLGAWVMPNSRRLFKALWTCVHRHRDGSEIQRFL